VRVGLHARNADDFTPLDYEIIRRANIETLKMMSQTKVEVYKQLRESFPNLEFIVRLRDERIGGNKASGQSWHPSASEFVTRFVPVITALRPYATKIEIHNEPNHQDLYEGWTPSLESARDFNRWFLDVYRGIKQACPWTELGFPGLALHPNGQIGADLEWAKQCAEAIKVADWLGVHCYWQYSNIWSLDWGFYFIQYHKLFSDKKIEITEFGNSTPKLDQKVMAREYTQYYDAIQRHGVYLRSASAFIATSPHAEWQEFCWGKSEDNRCYPVVDSVRTVNRPQAIDESLIDRVPGIIERRFLLPSRKDAGFYDARDVKDIRNIIIHHSEGTSATAEQIAAWAVTQTDRDPYPEMPYHFLVEPDGAIKRCHALDALSWHAGAKGEPTANGVGLNNWEGVAVCLAGNFMGAARPTDAQLRSAAVLCRAIRETVGADLRILGHRETPYSKTACPGDTFLGETGWKVTLLKLIEPRPDYAFTLAHKTPPQMQAGKPVNIVVVLKNSGARTWTAKGDKAFRLSYHWLDATGKVAVSDGERTELPGDVAPDQSVTLRARVLAPPTPGRYTLRWDMVEELVTWFSQQGAAVVDHAVEIQARPSRAWTLSASKATGDAGKAVDGDATTAWLSGAPQADGDWLQIDLGRIQLISGLRAECPAGAYPYGFAITVSTDAQQWLEALRQEGAQAGPIDVTFAPQRARFVRLQVILPAWGVSEIDVQSEVEPEALASASHNPTAAGLALDGNPATAWSSKEGQAPGMWFQLDLGAIRRIKGVTLDGPQGEEARGFKVSISADGQTWAEVAAKAQNFQPVAVAIPFLLGRFVKIETTATEKFNRPWTIREAKVQTAATWSVKASHGAETAALAIDGDARTAWSTGVPQTPGMWVELDLGEALTVSKVELVGAREFPRGLKISASADGKNWQAVASRERIFSSPVVVPLDAPTQTRYLRLEQTSSYIEESRYKIPWAISEILVS
jgi:hypothetical protein